MAEISCEHERIISCVGPHIPECVAGDGGQCSPYSELVVASIRVTAADSIDELPFQDPLPIRNLQSSDSRPEGDNPHSYPCDRMVKHETWYPSSFLFARPNEEIIGQHQRNWKPQECHFQTREWYPSKQSSARHHTCEDSLRISHIKS